MDEKERQEIINLIMTYSPKKHKNTGNAPSGTEKKSKICPVCLTDWSFRYWDAGSGTIEARFKRCERCGYSNWDDALIRGLKERLKYPAHHKFSDDELEAWRDDLRTLKENWEILGIVGFKVSHSPTDGEKK